MPHPIDHPGWLYEGSWIINLTTNQVVQVQRIIRELLEVEVLLHPERTVATLQRPLTDWQPTAPPSWQVGTKLRARPGNPLNLYEERDIFILSRGHGSVEIEVDLGLGLMPLPVRVLDLSLGDPYWFDVVSDQYGEPVRRKSTNHSSRFHRILDSED